MGNGTLPNSALTAIPGGRLEHSAAAAWNAGPGKAGLRPLGPNSSYRTYAAQQYYWNLYVSGRGNLAARPGTSNHGWGRAVDLAAPWMRSWIDNNGARYGWRKVEAPSEWWHVNYVGGFSAPPKKPSAIKSLAADERKIAHAYLYHRHKMFSESKSGKGPKYKRHRAEMLKCRSWLNKRANLLYSLGKKQGFKKLDRGARRTIIRKVVTGKIQWNDVS